MTRFESEYTMVGAAAGEVYNFLHNLDNHRLLMPSSVSEWWSNQTEAKLKIQGLGSLHLRLDGVSPFSMIRIVPVVKPIVDMELVWEIKEEGGNTSARVTINADLNMMMKLVAGKSLQSLADHMARRLNEALTGTN